MHKDQERLLLECVADTNLQINSSHRSTFMSFSKLIPRILSILERFKITTDVSLCLEVVPIQIRLKLPDGKKKRWWLTILQRLASSSEQILNVPIDFLKAQHRCIDSVESHKPERAPLELGFPFLFVVYSPGALIVVFRKEVPILDAR